MPERKVEVTISFTLDEATALKEALEEQRRQWQTIGRLIRITEDERAVYNGKADRLTAILQRF